MSSTQPDRLHASSGILRLAEEFCPFAFLTLLAVPLLTVSCTPAGPEDFQELAAAHQATIEGEVRVPGLEAEVEVLRDPWGVPHIYAQNLDDLFFAQGYVQAQDRLWQMEMYRRAGEGRLSETLGPDALVHDRLARLLKYRGPGLTRNSRAITRRVGGFWRPSLVESTPIWRWPGTDFRWNLP